MKRILKSLILVALVFVGFNVYQAKSAQAEMATAQSIAKTQGSTDFSATQLAFTINNQIRQAMNSMPALCEVKGEEVQERIDIPSFVKGVDFSKADENCVAWIYIPSVDLSYPVYQGEDNDFYLNHDGQGKKSSHGEIFLNSTNDAEFSDENTFVFGHNMKDRSMFGSLKNCDITDYIWVITPEHTYTYQVFSKYNTNENSDMFVTIDMDQHVNYVSKALALGEQDNCVNTSGKLLTLVTCSGVAHSGQRLFVHGSLVQTL